MKFILRWNITSNCRYNCKHCYNRKNRYSNNEDLPISKLDVVLSKLDNKFIKHIKLSGGEPFDYENFDYLCKKLEEKNINFGVSTSGLIDISKTNLINNKNFIFCTISLDGNNKETASFFRIDSDYDIIKKNIENLRRKNKEIKIAINIVINKINVERIYEILKSYFYDLKVDKVNIATLKAMSISQKKYICNTMEYYNMLKEIKKFKEEYYEENGNDANIELSLSCNNIFEEIDSTIFSEKFNLNYSCQAGKTMAFIDNYGNLLPCDAITNTSLYSAYKNNKSYSLLYNSFADILMEYLFNEVYQFDMTFRFGTKSHIKRCEKCIHRKMNCGRCYFYDK